MTQERLVAFCLVAQSELERLGANFDRAYPIGDTPGFDDLLAAIEAAQTSLPQAEASDRPWS